MAKCFGNSIVGTNGVNGDAFYISADNSTIVLADGASGAGADGKIIMSKCCVENIEAFPFSKANLSPKEYIEKIIWKINNELIQHSQKQNKYIFGTLVICIISNNVATFASIGDSPAFLIKEGKIKRVSKTKKTYDNLIQMGIFTEKQLEEYVHRLPEHMWSMFDTFIPMVVPKYSLEEYELNLGDTIILCCDGVSDYLSDDELLELVNRQDLLESVNAIISKSKENAIEEHNRNQYDDITVVLYNH